MANLTKKADVGLGVILVILIIVLFLGWLVNEGWKECKVNSDCKETQYCGSDFSCHDFKIIKEPAYPAPAINYTAIAWIIGICLIIAAIIMKWDSIFRRDNSPPKKKLSSNEYVILGKHKAEELGLFEEELQKE